MTKIEWTRGDDGAEGRTWNPTTGCDRTSPGCDNCYALTMAARLKGMGQAKYHQADDALLDKLAVVDDFDAWLARANAAMIARQARHFDIEGELERIKLAAECGRPLVAWRRDVETEPIGAELADTDTAVLGGQGRILFATTRITVLDRTPGRCRARHCDLVRSGDPGVAGDPVSTALWCQPCAQVHHFTVAEVERLVYAAQAHAGECDTGDDDSPWRGEDFHMSCLLTFLAMADDPNTYAEHVTSLAVAREAACAAPEPPPIHPPGGVLRHPATVTTSTGEQPGWWTWDPARPWVVHLVVPQPDGGFVVARIGREVLSLVLRGSPLVVCWPDVQVWLDTLFSPVPTLRVQLNPAPARGDRPGARTRRWRTDPATAAEFLAATEELIPMCQHPTCCGGCLECTAIADRIDILTARRGVR